MAAGEPSISDGACIGSVVHSTSSNDDSGGPPMSRPRPKSSPGSRPQPRLNASRQQAAADARSASRTCLTAAPRQSRPPTPQASQVEQQGSSPINFGHWSNLTQGSQDSNPAPDRPQSDAPALQEPVPLPDLQQVKLTSVRHNHAIKRSAFACHSFNC